MKAHQKHYLSCHLAARQYYDADLVWDYLLGYIQRDNNRTIADFLEMGWDGAFRCVISGINSDTHPENQVHLTISLLRHKEETESKTTKSRK